MGRPNGGGRGSEAPTPSMTMASRNVTQETNRRRDLRIGTWNIRTLKDKKKMLGEEADKFKLDLIAIQETRLLGEGEQVIKGHTLFHGGATKHRCGTGFLVSARILPTVREVSFINDRLSYMVLDGRWYRYVLINVHCPTEDKDSDIKDSFYEEIEKVFDRFSSYHARIVLGDFNAKIGREESFRPNIGKESLHEISNDNGIRAASFAASKNLIIRSTYFTHKDIHKATWTSPDGQTRNQIDHILIDKRHSANILDTRTYRGADCDSDHFLVVAKLRARLARKTTQNPRDERRKIDRFNVEKLNIKEERVKYQEGINNRFQALGDLETTEDEQIIEEEWERTKTTILEIATETIGIKEKKTRREPYFDDECKEIWEQSHEARIQALDKDNREAIEKFKEIRRKARRLLRAKKRNWETNKVEHLADQGNDGSIM